MSRKFKRSFIGYKQKDVIEEFEIQKADFDKLNSDYDEEILQLNNEINQLRQEIEKLQLDMTQRSEKKKKVQDILYNAHLDACMEIHEIEKKFEEMIQYKTNIIKNQQKKNLEIKVSINKLMKKLQWIIMDEDDREVKNYVSKEQKSENIFIRTKQGSS